jgi:hypothetical protein
MKHEKFEKRAVFCMFRRTDNELGYIQCTIKAEFKAEFIKLGFVDHVDKLERKKPKKAKKAEKKEPDNLELPIE